MMNIVSYNIRGCGNPTKSRRLKEFVLQGKFDLCLVQDTKKSSVDEAFVCSLWGYEAIERTKKYDVGLSKFFIKKY